MMRLRFLAILLIGSLLGPVYDLPAIANRSVSGSAQFNVFCPDRPLRERLAGAFDEVRTALLSELAINYGATTPIYVNISQRKIIEYNAPTWNMRWLDAPDGARVQLDVLVDDEMKEQRLQEHIVSALLLTIKYRDKPPSGGDAYEEPPNWLVEGLSEKIRQRTRDPDAGLYRGLLNAKKMPDLADWLKINPATLDATSLGIYRAYACALVTFFEGEPGGKEKLKQFLQKAPVETAQSIEWLAKNFPNMGENGKNLTKWWSLSLAKLSASDRYEAWSGTQSEEALAKSLSFRIFNKVEFKNFTLEQYPDFLKLPGCPDALGRMNNDLIRLTLHAHPLFRPVLAGYQDILGRLQKGKTKGVSEKLAELAELRIELNRRLEDVSDYLTWFEATQISRGSSDFDGYFKLMQSFQTPRQPSREPIGRYLDSMEAELKN